MRPGSSLDNVSAALAAPLPGVVASNSSGLRCATSTHPGVWRSANEDSCGADPSLGAFVVCDGMGGAAAGDVASQLARDTFLSSLSGRSGSPAARLAEAVRASNAAVFRQAQRSRAQRGMGTTLVGLLCETGSQQPSAWVAHVGDSRCYRLRDGRLELLTCDHSLVEEQIQAGLITRAEADSSPVRNIITRAVGSNHSVDPEITQYPIESGDVFLLASDGLTRELPDDAIARILRASLADAADLASPSAETLERACNDLIQAANENGGRDNITVLLVAFP